MSKTDKIFEEWAMCASTMPMVDFEEYESRRKELVDKATPKQVLDEHIYIERKGVCKVVHNAIHSPNHIQKHKELLSELHETYKDKNHKYGDSFTETVNKYGLIAAITRMHDKFSRIENIITQKVEDDEEERLSDSLKDLANYCLMTVMVLENKND